MFVKTCDRCGDNFSGDSYSVRSQDDGEKLLDMVVCYDCYIEASQLGLDTQPVALGPLRSNALRPS